MSARRSRFGWFLVATLVGGAACEGQIGGVAERADTGPSEDAGAEPGLDPNRPFEALEADAALRKVKTFLLGRSPTADEYRRYVDDPTALPALIEEWLTDPELGPRLQEMFRVMFQQWGYSDDVGLYFREQNTDIFEQRQGRGGVDLQGPLGDSWARTAWQIVADDRPFTEVVTTSTYQLTVPLMMALAYIDATPRDDANLYIPNHSWLEQKHPNLRVSYTRSRDIPFTESTNPASPDFGVFSIGEPDGSAAGSSACNGLNEEHEGRSGIEEIFKTMMGAPWRTTCWSWNGAQANVFEEGDLAYRPVTIRRAAEGEERTTFWDLQTLRTTDELVLGADYVGFFGSLGFLANWTTNDANEFRVTANQTLIVALGRTFDPGDINFPSAPASLDEEHAAPDSPCYSCHVYLDPLRDFFRMSYTYWGTPRTDRGQNDPIPDKAVFSLDGSPEVEGTSVADLGRALAEHPRFARAWAEKLCLLANARDCDAEDPELHRIAEVFEQADFNFKVLLRELLSSPVVTYQARTRTWETRGATAGTALRGDFCRRLETRVGIVDACNRFDLLDAQPGARDQAKGAAGVLSSIGFSRGSVEPQQPVMPGLFTTAAAETLCETLGDGLRRTTTLDATRREEAIEILLTEVMGVWSASEKAPELRAVLNEHWDGALQRGEPDEVALGATFVLACTSPLTTGLGL